jgi:two-component system, LytTR family, sensor histidine kinase AlgZ
MRQHPTTEPFLPNFCAGRAVFTMLVISEIVAAVLALAQTVDLSTLSERFLPLALFLPWIGLASAAVLCGLRRSPLGAHPLRLASSAFIAMVLTHVFIAQAAWNLTDWFGLEHQLIASDEVNFLIRNLGLSFIVTSLILAYFFLLHQWQDTVQLQARSREAALRARIRPHFLFNALNTAAALIRTEPAAAELVVEDLSELFRASLNPRDRVTLADELAFAKLYQRLEQTRLGDRLRVDWAVDALPGDLMVPALILQPLLENAVGHGIEQLPGGGTVSVVGELVEGMVRLTVRNPVPDIDTLSGHSMALDNIGERLELVYGDTASLAVESGPDGFRVTLEFPELKMR